MEVLRSVFATEIWALCDLITGFATAALLFAADQGHTVLNGS